VRVALIGLSNSGKTVVFNALTGKNLETTIYPTTSGEPNREVVKVPDARLDKLSAIFKPKKTTYAIVEYVDYIGLTKGDVNQNRKVFDLIKDVDALVHVVRAFENDLVAHPMNEVNPLQDIETVEFELIFGDLELIGKRLERIEEGLKKGKKPDEAEKRLLMKCRDALEKEIPLRNIAFSEEEQKAIRHLQFVSIKPEVVVLNTGEKDLNTDKSVHLQREAERYFSHRITAQFQRSLTKVVTLCGKVEMEIAQLSPDDAKPFLDEMGIREPALTRLIHASYEVLGLITFFSYAGDEVRAWGIPEGTNALKAAGKIHSDIERGFIRAEVVSFDNFISAGSIHAAKEKGILRLEGKTYEVKDGDIINFRFSA